MLSTCFTNLPLLHHHHFFNSIVNTFYQTHSGLRQFKNMSQKGECFLQLRNSWSLLLFLAFHKINMYTLSIPNKHFRICEKKYLSIISVPSCFGELERLQCLKIQCLCVCVPVCLFSQRFLALAALINMVNDEKCPLSL